MLSKARLKYVQSLRQRKFRKLHRQFVVEGTTGVLDFLSGTRLPVDEVFAQQSWIEKHGKKAGKTRITAVSHKELERMSSLKTAPEVLALVSMPDEQRFDWKSSGRLTLLLDDLKDPGNLGTIIRTADWFGIGTVVCSPETVDCFNPKVVQATMGSLARIRVVYTDLEKLVKSRPEGVTVYGTFLEGTPLNRLAPSFPAAILIGSEAHGISPVLERLTDQKITIPKSVKSGAESLNASIATAIICYAFSAK